MPDDFDELGFLTDTDPEARAMAEALRRRLRRQRPQALALALSPEAGARSTGESLLAASQRGEERLGEFSKARLQHQMEERKLDLERAKLAIARQLAGRFQHVTIPGIGEPLTFDPVTGGYGRPFAPPGAGPLPPLTKALTEDQGKAHQQLKLARTALQDVMRLGRDVLPQTGFAGTGEAIGWALRERAGMPMFSSSAAQQRQSALLSVAEPVARSLSGANTPEPEVRRFALQMVPSPGESPPEQLAKLRRLVENAGSAMGRLPSNLAQEHVPFWNELRDWYGRLVSEVQGGQEQQAPGQEQGPTSRSGRAIFQR